MKKLVASGFLVLALCSAAHAETGGFQAGPGAVTLQPTNAFTGEGEITAGASATTTNAPAAPQSGTESIDLGAASDRLESLGIVGDSSQFMTELYGDIGGTEYVTAMNSPASPVRFRTFLACTAACSRDYPITWWSGPQAYNSCVSMCATFLHWGCNGLWAACFRMPDKYSKESCLSVYNIVCAGE